MELENYQLFINGKPFEKRGLDLACNPFSGRVVGDVVLVSDSLLERVSESPDEETVALFPERGLN